MGRPARFRSIYVAVMRKPSARGTSRGGFRVTPLTVIAAAVAVLLVVSQVYVTGSFFSHASLSVLTPLIGVMVIVAVGQAFVMGTGGIDLSVPAVMTLMGAIILKQSQGQNGRLAGALVLCLVACIVIGLINGLLVEILRLNALVVTLAVGQLVAGYTRIYSGQVLAYNNVPGDLSSAAGAQVGGISYILIVSVGMAIIGGFYLHRVVSGRRLVISSAAPTTAKLTGVRASGYRVLAYVLAACSYGVGAVLLAGQLGTPDLTLGDPYLLTSIVAVVLGGAALTGGRVSPIATLLGAAFVTILDYDLRVKNYSAGARMLVQGVVLVLALSLPYGLRYIARLRGLLRHGGGAPPPLEFDQGAVPVN
jgi:ribose transport system permease protein